VNPDVDGYPKSRENAPKKAKRQQPTKNQLKAYQNRNIS